ncbi:hypothetical protein AB0B25_16930 [Nocardia sp. NPDC049190]|uniref:hypothetical protein n=1 Tax=Nocardia sp. NPDC049190 TaxID=3155650 RepID=UPI0033F0E397
MSQSLNIDADLVRALISELSAAAGQAQLHLNELKDALAGEGEPWGDDEPGRSIGEAYVPQAEKTLEGYQNLVDNLRDLSKGVADVAAGFDQRDRDSGAMIDRLGRDGFGPDIASPSWYSPQSLDTPPTAYSSDFAPIVEGSNGVQRPAPDWSTLSGDDPSAGTAVPSAGDGSVGDPASTGPQPANAEPCVPQDSRDATVGGAPGALGRPAPQPAASPRLRPPWSVRPSGPGVSPARAATTAEGKQAGTPWSRGGPGGPTPPPGAAHSPWSPPRPGSRPPGRVFGPEQAGPGAAPAQPNPSKRNSKSRTKKAVTVEQDAVATPTDAQALEAAAVMAERHGIQLVGFDTSGIAVATVAEIAAALDDILGKYPFIEVGGIEIGELGGGRISRVRWDRVGAEPEQDRGDRPWLLLDRILVANPARLGVHARAAIRSGELAPGSAERLMYSVVVGDLGRILENMAGPHPRRSAQRALITEYHRISGSWAGRDTLARVVAGYRRWRNQLGGGSITDGRFQPRAALVAAFTEVEVRGPVACGPAKVLHLLVVEGARGRSGSL